MEKITVKDFESEFDKILKDVFNSVTLTEVESKGIALRSKTSDKDDFGFWYEVFLYEYNNDKYIIAYKCKDNYRENVKFDEYKKVIVC